MSEDKKELKNTFDGLINTNETIGNISLFRDIIKSLISNAITVNTDVYTKLFINAFYPFCCTEEEITDAHTWCKLVLNECIEKYEHRYSDEITLKVATSIIDLAHTIVVVRYLENLGMYTEEEILCID